MKKHIQLPIEIDRFDVQNLYVKFNNFENQRYFLFNILFHTFNKNDGYKDFLAKSSPAQTETHNYTGLWDNLEW